MAEWRYAKAALIGVEVPPESEQESGKKPRITHLPSIFLTWTLVLVVILWVNFSYPAGVRPKLLVGVIGFAAILTFFVQLLTAEKRGFIVRVSVTLAGALVIMFAVDMASRLLRYFA
ncbi:MAG: hypothetical protein Q4C71_03215 [Microbacteriaceae bacterium]|nr:hypothetical protein [Microbacteriaceae bacterium]